MYIDAGRRHSNQEEALLTSLANALAGVIRRRRAEQKVAQQLDRTKLLNRLTRAAVERTDLVSILQVALEVSDTGVGRDEKTRQRCLEPFYTTKGEQGTGLGLAMVYGIVQRHRGEGEIQSELGRGTTFRMLLPLGEEPTPTAAPADTGETSTGLHLLWTPESQTRGCAPGPPLHLARPHRRSTCFTSRWHCPAEPTDRGPRW